MKNFLKICAISSTMLATSFSASAHDFEVSDFVIAQGGTATISVFVNLDSDMNGGGFDLAIVPPTGYTFKNAKVGDALNDAQAKSGMVNRSGVCKFNAANANLETGKTLIGTVDITANATAENAELTLKNMYIRVWVENADGEWEKQDNYMDDRTVITNVLRDLTISEVGYATFSACAPVKIEGGTICTGVLNGDKTMLTVTEETGSVVPANTGVIIKGEAGKTTTVTLAPATEAGSVGDNDLVSSKEAKKKDNVLALTVNEGAPVFWRWDSNYEIPDNKAFLPWTGNNAPVRIDFGGNSIESVNAERNIGYNYNLMGLQVKAQKGIVIENGKKVINL